MMGAVAGKKCLYSLAITTLVAATLVIGALAATNSRETRKTTVVPEAFANDRGARKWDAATRQAFLQSPPNRWMLSGTDINSRGGQGPGEWLPPLDQCLYLSRFVATLERFDLNSNTAEMQQLALQRQRCYTQFQ